MAGTGWKQPELCRKTGNGFEWLEVITNGWKWSEILGNRWKWLEMA